MLTFDLICQYFKSTTREKMSLIFSALLGGKIGPLILHSGSNFLDMPDLASNFNGLKSHKER